MDGNKIGNDDGWSWRSHASRFPSALSSASWLSTLYDILPSRDTMPSLFAWWRALRPLGSKSYTPSLSSYARALSSRAAHQTSLDDAKREKQRLRYRDDPEYRQRRIDANSRYNAKNKEEVNQRHRERYQSDPEFREHRLQQIKKWRASQGLEWHRRWGYPSGKKASERKMADDALHEQYRVYQRAYSKKRYSDPQQKFYAGLRDWFYRHKQKLDHCVWKHYTPIFHAEKVERTCATCAKTRINGGKLCMLTPAFKIYEWSCKPY